MKTIKGPAIFLAQFAGDAAPFNSFDAICEWAASLGYKGVQIPTWDGRLFDLKKASDSKDYAERAKGIFQETGWEILPWEPPDEWPKTEFEQHFLSTGVEIRRFQATR